eukprot:11217043-Lingulodinium_polyedra.AAC.1
MFVALSAYRLAVAALCIFCSPRLHFCCCHNAPQHTENTPPPRAVPLQLPQRPRASSVHVAL